MVVAAVVLTTLLRRDWPAHHFAVVEECVLYRGGQPDAAGLEHIINRYSVKTVINLRGAEPEAQWWLVERGACQRRGVHLVDLPIGGHETAASKLKQFLEIATDPAKQPVFVHCEAGSARTGYVAAAYRIVVQNWTYRQAMKEAAALRFHLRSRQNLEYDRILYELSEGADWRRLRDFATTRPDAATRTGDP